MDDDQAPAIEASLEQVVFGSVAVTTRAVAKTGLELTFPQWRVLVVLGGCPDGATVSEIASRIGAALSPASRLITRLETRGYVVTRKDLDDRRATRVRLTPLGADVRKKVVDERRRYLAEAVAEASPVTPEEAGLLERLGRALERFG